VTAAPEPRPVAVIKVKALTEREAALEQMRETVAEVRRETMGAVWRSRLSYEQIFERGGPCPSTLHNWAAGTIQHPRLDTILRCLIAVGEAGAVEALIERLKLSAQAAAN